MQEMRFGFFRGSKGPKNVQLTLTEEFSDDAGKDLKGPFDLPLST